MGMYIEMYAIHVIHTIRMCMFPVYTFRYLYDIYIYVCVLFAIWKYICCIYIYIYIWCFIMYCTKYIYIYAYINLSLYIYIIICSIWTLPFFWVVRLAIRPLKSPVGSRWPRLIHGMFPKSWVPSGKLTIVWTWSFIVDFPIKKDDFP